MIVTRFAPSPNGPLHLGHAYSAIVAHDLARERGGRFLLRIEDIDGARSRPELADEFRRDLAWLGLEWEEVPAQSTRLDSYAAAARAADGEGPALSAAPAPAPRSPPRQPRRARRAGLSRHLQGQRVRSREPVGLAARRGRGAGAAPGRSPGTTTAAGRMVATRANSAMSVLVRKDAPASYHLAATLDDAADGVTLVTRGMDLFPATHIHRLLQALLGLPVPRWHHHRAAARRGGPEAGQAARFALAGRPASASGRGWAGAGR